MSADEPEKVAILNGLKIDNSTAIERTKLFDKGSYDFTAHGIFNPSVVSDGNDLTLIFRTEPSEATWSGYLLTDKGVPQISEGTISRRGIDIQPPSPIMSGMPLSCRPEDWRLFRHKDHIYTNFTNYFYLNKGWPQKQVQCRTALGILLDNRISFIREMHGHRVGVKTRREEKNWVFYSYKDQMYCLYSIEPWVLFKCDDGGGVLEVVTTEMRLPRLGWKYLSNSTNPILVTVPHYGECFLMFCHQFMTPKGKGSRNRTYYQHAILFDCKTMIPFAWTPQPFVGGGISTGGRHDGVVYFSGAFAWDRAVYVFSGEGDSYSAMYKIKITDLMKHMYAL